MVHCPAAHICLHKGRPGEGQVQRCRRGEVEGIAGHAGMMSSITSLQWNRSCSACACGNTWEMLHDRAYYQCRSDKADWSSNLGTFWFKISGCPPPNILYMTDACCASRSQPANRQLPVVRLGTCSISTGAGSFVLESCDISAMTCVAIIKSNACC